MAAQGERGGSLSAGHCRYSHANASRMPAMRPSKMTMVTNKLRIEGTPQALAWQRQSVGASVALNERPQRAQQDQAHNADYDSQRHKPARAFGGKTAPVVPLAWLHSRNRYALCERRRLARSRGGHMG